MKKETRTWLYDLTMLIVVKTIIRLIIELISEWTHKKKLQKLEKSQN